MGDWNLVDGEYMDVLRESLNEIPSELSPTSQRLTEIGNSIAASSKSKSLRLYRVIQSEQDKIRKMMEKEENEEKEKRVYFDWSPYKGTMQMIKTFNPGQSAKDWWDLFIVEVSSNVSAECLKTIKANKANGIKKFYNI